ncbi:esterase/lipase superfamily enzyme [Bradyrhizobium sp. i1.4.4]
MQCQVFAAVSAQNGRSLTQALQRPPEAAELYFSEFVTEKTEFDRIAQQIGVALDETARLFVDVVSELPGPLIAEYNALFPEGVPVLVSSEKQQTKTDYISPLRHDVKSGQYKVWYGTNRRPLDPSDPGRGYSADPDDRVHYGCCTAFVPAAHVIGGFRLPWWRRLLRGKTDALTLLDNKIYAENDFWNAISLGWDQLDRQDRHSVVLVHGYNVSFESAALQAAQIGYDLSINGAMAFFSWPSRGALADYLVDEDLVEQSEGAIAGFLVDFATKSGADVVHVIAHSMGNRGVLRAINRVAQLAEKNTKLRFGQVALAAADVNSNTFRSLCDAYSRVAKRTTLYVSGGDLAIRAAVLLRKFPRVGLLPPVFVAPGIDTVNVSNVDLGDIGHSYIAEAREVLADLYDFLLNGTPPERRFGLTKETTEAGETFWTIRK